MTCCPSNRTTFANKTTTTVPYGGEYGAKPLIEVLYLIDGVWTQQGVFTQIKIESGQIVVDHGGPATGLIKIS